MRSLRLSIGALCVCFVIWSAIASATRDTMSPTKIRTMTTQQVVALLADKNPIVRGLAARDLGERHATDAIGALRGLLTDELTAVRGEAAASLLALGDDTGKPLLHDLLKTGSPETALRAACALAHSGDDAGMELAKTHIKSSYFTIRECAIEALAASKDETVAYSALQAGLNDTSSDVRKRTLSLLGQRSTDRSLQMIKTMLASRDASERREAVIAVVDTQLWQGIPVLIDALPDSDQQVRETAERWLKEEVGSEGPKGSVKDAADAVKLQGTWRTWWQDNKGRFSDGSKTPVKRRPPSNYPI